MTRILCLLLSLAPLPATAQQIISCVLRPINEIEIAPPVSGLLAELTVDRGDRVTAGEVIGRLEAGVVEAQLAAARQRAESGAAILARDAQLADAERRLAQMQSLSDRGVASQNQLDEIVSEVEVARSELAEAHDAQIAARLEAEAAAANVALRTIRAPVSGHVLMRHVDPGEYAAADEPLLDIVTVSELHAEVLLPSDVHGTVAQGDTVEVMSLEGAGVRRAGLVDAVDPVIDAASRSFGLRVRLDNGDGAFTAGNRCDVMFGAGDETGD
ncbi:efflux RND transporter periplasmic adaptor subunit [Roseisalinus antarcticus]|uniref:Multidrug efflux system subunit MdtA n=1 Tax=Roseisalinus antarcticus TaxID=254357 RepID=A0A1Y5TFT1_9RHOB|nr:efflux RND transporter periplasmic adaptor subunit [Roseisalinus antarcticus]SLN63067.1 multidrug efflux system subunit MdtA [Roseisalinus antarcticus]